MRFLPMLKSNFGLGDLAYYLFRPVVYAIDFAWGTDLRDCDVCKARRARWNALFSIPGWAAIFLLTAAIFTLLYTYKH